MKKSLTGAAAAAMLAAAMLALPAVAGRDTGARGGRGAGGDSRLTMLDRRFVLEAAHGGMMEVDLAQLAERQASRDAVRSFARRMIRDHEPNNRELMSLAGRKGITLPRSLDGFGTAGREGAAGGPGGGPGLTRVGDREAGGAGGTVDMGELGLRHMVVQHQEERAMLSRLNGPMFDQAYMGDQVKMHSHMVAAFETHARTSQDPDVRAYAERSLPVLREHLRMAREIVGLGPGEGSGRGDDRRSRAGSRDREGDRGR